MTPSQKITDPSAYLRSISVPFDLPRVTDPVILNALKEAGHITSFDSKGSVEDPLGSDQTRINFEGQRYCISYQSMGFTKRVFHFGKAI